MAVLPFLRLSVGDVEESQEKESGEEVEHPVFAFGAAGE